MPELVRLVYASYSSSTASLSGIQPEIGTILTQSRKNNARAQISGVLYFGDGCFFQCLEGEESRVKETYTRIQQDPRHMDAAIIRQEVILRRMFKDWSMKYVPAEQDVQAFLQDHGMARFDPMNMDADAIDDLLKLFQTASNSDVPVAPALAQAQSRTANKERGLFKRIAGGLGLGNQT